jgi:hypothetical protein
MPACMKNRSPPVVDALRNAGLTEVAHEAFGHLLVPAQEVLMANALFLRDLDHVATRVAPTGLIERARPLGALLNNLSPLRGGRV